MTDPVEASGAGANRVPRATAPTCNLTVVVRDADAKKHDDFVLEATGEGFL